jgi:protein required for attachment to host cells
MNTRARYQTRLTRIIVADQAEARFYDLSDDAQLQIAGHLSNASARLHDRDLKSDRPGRVFDRAPPASGRRGSVAHHATGGSQSPRKHESALFARRIAVALVRAHRAGQFDQLVIMAGSPFLGLLRAALPGSLGQSVVAEVAKDLVHQPETAVRAHLPEDLKPRAKM